MDVFKTLLLDSPTVLADGTGLLQSSNNLSDVDSVSTARDNLGISSSQEAAGNFTDGFAISDGSTSGRGEFVAYGSDGDVAGLAASMLLEIPVPASNPGSTMRIIDLNPDTTPSDGYSITAVIDSSGGLQLEEKAASSSHRRNLTYSGFLAAYAGQFVLMDIVWAAGNSTTAPVITCQGVDISSEFSLTVVGTGSNWLSTNLDPVWHITGYNWGAGRAPRTRLVVGALSAAEAIAHTSGTPLEEAAPWTNTPGVAGSVNGPLDKPIYQPALVTDDAFGRFSRRLVGMTPVCDKSDFRIIGNTSTSGNEQIASGAVLEDTDAVFDSIEFDTDGTPTITLGSASGGAQYVASTTLAAGLNADETQVTRKAATDDLWVGSNGTSNVRTYVSGHKITGV